jgi:hypothetical protein
MSLPICDSCASSGVLCSACKKKLDEGKISELDLRLSRELHHYKVSCYDKAFEMNGFVIVLAPAEVVPRIIGRGGGTAKRLSRKLDKHVIVIESGNSSDYRKVAEAVIRPDRVVSIGKIYKKDGTEVLKIITQKKGERKNAKIVIELVIGREVEIE